jgi:hypothetical protein
MYLVFVLMWMPRACISPWFDEEPTDGSSLVPRLLFDPLVLTVIALMVGRRGQALILTFLVVHEAAVPSNLFGLRG